MAQARMLPLPQSRFLMFTQLHYYRVVMLLFSLLYVVSAFLIKPGEAVNEFAVPRLWVSLLPFSIFLISFFEPVKKQISRVAVGFFLLATIHLTGFLLHNKFNTHYEVIILTLILFSNLHANSIIALVLYNVSVLGFLEFILIAGSTNATVNPVIMFVSVVIIMLLSVFYRIYVIRQSAANTAREKFLDSLFRQSVNAKLLFDKKTLELADANDRACELFGIDKSNIENENINLQSLLSLQSLSYNEITRMAAGGLFAGRIVRINNAEGQNIALSCSLNTLAEYDNILLCTCSPADKNVQTELNYATPENFINSIPFAAAIATSGGEIIFRNEEANSIISSKQLGISNNSIFSLVDDDTALMLPNLENGSSFDYELANTAVRLRFVKTLMSGVEYLTIYFKDHAAASTLPVQNNPLFLNPFFEQDYFGVAKLNSNNFFIEINQRFCDVAGYTADELRKLSLTDLLHPGEMLKLSSPHNGEGVQLQARKLLHKNGYTVFINLISWEALNTGSERMILIEDISVQVKTQRELQSARANVVAVMENTNDFIFSADVNHIITVINSAYKNFFLEYYEKELNQGNNYKLSLPQSEQVQWQNNHAAVMKGNKVSYRDSLMDDEGNKHVYEISLNPIISDNNLVTGVSFFGREITDRISYETEIIKAKEIAEEATNAKSKFLATMSHEIRTPLNGMLGMLELLRTTQLGKKQAEYVNTIQLSGESLLTIINDVLDFSKIESGKMELENKPFILRKVVDEVFDLLYYRALEKQIELFYSIDSEIPAAIMGDSLRLKQVLINLAGNAIKFTSSGHILITITREKAEADAIELKFSVKDTGIGMTPEQMQNLFSEFTQADASIYRRYGGTGLGLTISNRLVTLMNGKIWAESEQEKGSTFFFTIQTKAAPLPKAQQVQSGFRMLKGKKIMLLTANADVKNTFENYFAEWSVTPAIAPNATAAITMLEKKNDFDGLLIDASLKNYLRYAEELREITSALRIPVVAVMADIGEEGDMVYGNKLFDAVISSLSSKLRTGSILNSVYYNLDKSLAYESQQAADVDEKLSTKIPLNILVAEDNSINRTLMEMILKKSGYATDLAADGKEAIEKINSKAYDLVFMDVQMPQLDGLEATKQIRSDAKYKNNPVIVAMTAFALAGDKEKCIEAGMNDYISKPIRIEDIQNIITRWFSEKKDNGAPPIHELASSVTLLDKKVISHLRELNPSDKGFVGSVATMFIEQGKNLIAEMENKFKQNDFDAVWKLAHKLKGSSINVGALRMAEVCKTIENNGRINENGNLKSYVEELKSVFAVTKTEYEKLTG